MEERIILKLIVNNQCVLMVGRVITVNNTTRNF